MINEQKIILNRSTIIIYREKFDDSNIFISTYNQKPHNYEYPHTEVRDILLRNTNIKNTISWTRDNHYNYPVGPDLPYDIQELLTPYQL